MMNKQEELTREEITDILYSIGDKIRKFRAKARDEINSIDHEIMTLIGKIEYDKNWPNDEEEK